MRAALRLLWALDVRHLVTHRTRLALSALGIAVGVALAVSVGSLSSSITGSLRSAAQAAAAEANIEVRPNGNAGLEPDLLERVLEAKGVEEAGATIESYVRARHGRKDVRVLALGIDAGIIAMSPRAVDADAARDIDPFGLFVPRSIAEELDVKAGDEIDLTTPSGWRGVKVSSVLDEGSGDHTRVVVSTVGVMQQLMRRGTRYDAIYVKAADPDAALETIQDAVGDAARVGPIAFRGEQLQQLLAGANASFAVGTLVALFVGAFLVYNTMAMAAVERIQEAALLRAVGAKRRQVFALFLAEGGLLGLVGSALGIGLGLLLASLLLTRQGGALEEIYPIQITTLTVSPGVLAAAGVAGVVASLAAAYLPARRIARADPAPSLGPTGVFEDPTARARRFSNIVGLVCVVAGPSIAIPALGSGADTTGPAMIGFAITLGGIALLIPTVVPKLADILLGALLRLRTTSGIVRLAAGELQRSPGRTSFTVGAVLLSLALVVGFSIGQTTFTQAFDAEFENIVSADLYVRSPTWRPFGSDVPMNHRISNEIEELPGVEAAWPFRLMPATYRERAIVVLAYDLDEYAQHSRVGDDARSDSIEQANAVGDRDAVLASASFLQQFGFDVGDTISLPTPTGLNRLEIAESFNDPSAITPEIIFDHRTFRRVWGSGGADTFAVVTTARSRTTEVQRTITEELGERYGFEVDTRDEYFGLLAGAVGSVTQLIGSVQLVAVIVAGLGLANTLLISTFERRRDLGVLRAIGMLRRQLRRMVAVEALLIGALGVMLAWILGTAIGLGMYALVEAQLGVPLEPAFPLVGYVGAAILGLSASLLASMYPAQRAARLDVVEALQYE
jgi:putative ABC transport system permease protein